MGVRSSVAGARRDLDSACERRGPARDEPLDCESPLLVRLEGDSEPAKLFDGSTRIHRARLILLQPAAAAAGEEIHWDTPAGRSVSSAVDVEGHTGLTLD